MYKRKEICLYVTMQYNMPIIFSQDCFNGIFSLQHMHKNIEVVAIGSIVGQKRCYQDYKIICVCYDIFIDSQIAIFKHVFPYFPWYERGWNQGY
jgi:hypothetical protein